MGARPGLADATFQDWGLAKATAVHLNAVLVGRLVIAPPPGRAAEHAR